MALEPRCCAGAVVAATGRRDRDDRLALSKSQLGPIEVMRFLRGTLARESFGSVKDSKGNMFVFP